MKVLGSTAAVIAAIQEDAAAELEAIERRTTAAVEAASADDAMRIDLPDRELRLSLARQEARQRVAQEAWEDTCSSLSTREAWMNTVVTLGRDRLAKPTETLEERRATLTALAREGLDRLTGSSVEIVLSAGDAAAVGPEWAASLGREVGRGIRAVAGPIVGGCIVRTADGRMSYDNTYSGRERRTEALWRAALVEMYERAEPASP